MAFYDDTEYLYTDFWQDRQYEHQSEIIALEKLLGQKKFKVGADIGGGFGRLSRWLADRCDKVYLVEPSAKMRQLARAKLSQRHKIFVRAGLAENTNLPTSSVNLVVMVRVLHHLPDPKATFIEMQRILKPKGLLIIEFANSLHVLARLKSLLQGKPILPIPIERRSRERIAAGSIPFVNHHPLTIKKLLLQHNFKLLKTLSVSNLRSNTLKKIIPKTVLLDLESKLQQPLSAAYFGPSIFLLAQKS